VEGAGMMPITYLEIMMLFLGFSVGIMALSLSALVIRDLWKGK
jgi:hypothetical protein